MVNNIPNLTTISEILPLMLAASKSKMPRVEVRIIPDFWVRGQLAVACKKLGINQTTVNMRFSDLFLADNYTSFKGL
jgi:hypothetical protein